MAKLTLFFKGRPIDVYHVENDAINIGRDPQCQLRIDSLAVGPFHAQIVREDDHYYLLSPSEDHPVLVNHKRVAEHELAHGDIIQIGKHTLNFADDAVGLSPTATPPERDQENPVPEDDNGSSREQDSKAGCIQILSGEHFGRVIPLDRAMTRLGRAGRDCAIIAHRRNGYYLSHLEGPHPPMVDGRPIGNRSMRLLDGNVIEIGSTRMQFYAKLA